MKGKQTAEGERRKS